MNSLPIDPSDSHAVWDFINQANIDVFGFAETNVDWLQPKVLGQFQKSIRTYTTDDGSQPWRHNRTVVSTSSVPFAGTRKPGGTAMGALGKWSTCTDETGVDPRGLGRWSYIKLRGRQGRKIVAITAYQVCQKHHARVGDTTNYHQQATLLRTAGVEDPDPRAEFSRDLQAAISEWQANGCSILLMTDANASLTTSNSWITRLCVSCNLRDIHAQVHADPGPTTYARSNNDRIDYILMSEDICPSAESCGIDPFYAGIRSDHRGLWLDLRISQLFKGNMQDPTHAASRRLVSKKQAAADRFTAEVWTQLAARKIDKRIATLSDNLQADRPIKPSSLESIDRDFSRAMHSAENKVCRRSSSFPWSPALAAATAAVAYWRILLSCRRNGIEPPPLTDLTTKARLTPGIGHSYTYKELFKAHRNASRHRKTSRQQAPKQREEFLRASISEAISEGRKADRTALQRIVKAERRLASFSRIRRHYKPANAGAVSKLEVEIPGQPGQYSVITDAEDMEARILLRNVQHFGQAQVTPFGSGPLAALLGLTGCNAFANDVLEGNPLPPEVDDDPGVRALLTAMQRPADMPEVSASITYDDVFNGFRKWRESTSTSPSGRHLGMYRLYTSDAVEEEESSSLDVSALTLKQIIRYLTNRKLLI